MSNRPDHLSDDVITQFLRTRSADPDLGLLNDLMRTVEATPQDRPWLGLRPIQLPPRTLLIVAIALLLATMGAIAVGAGLLRPDPTSVERMVTIVDAVEAINARDVAALRSAFAADGLLEFPGVDGRAGREGEVYMSDKTVDEVASPAGQPTSWWMRLLDSWGLEARLGSCRTQPESRISCAVVTAWHVLQIEIGEEWTFDFDGVRVRRLQMVRVDPDPSNRVLPLGFADLERWEAWLRETHPEQAERLLPTGPDVFAHYYFRFGLGADPAEIRASIREYVARR